MAPVWADTLVNNNAQDTTADLLQEQYDIGDLVSDMVSFGRREKKEKKNSPFTIIPNIAANPSIGLQGGIKAVAGAKLGTDPGTYMSVAATSASITTKGIILFYLNHNIFTNSNKWNIQGGLVGAKTVIPDYGLGIGIGGGSSQEDKILTNPSRKGYVLEGMYFNFKEKIYKEVFRNFFVGAGVSVEIKRNIRNTASDAGERTPFEIYNSRNGFERDRYNSNGLLLSWQYTSRDNQNRAYKGVFFDAGFRVNQKWMGSTRGGAQFTHDFRKYWSLSQKNPEHVLAFWNWGSYVFAGALPYLELPGTGKDPLSRSGRGYYIGYFKGTQFAYNEVEYRFPILRNNFLSGVTFFHLQSANDQLGTTIFEKWQPGGGVGLRVLFNKFTRTNLCLDYAFGNYGSRGFFLGINEAF